MSLYKTVGQFEVSDEDKEIYCAGYTQGYKDGAR